MRYKKQGIITLISIIIFLITINDANCIVYNYTSDFNKGGTDTSKITVLNSTYAKYETTTALGDDVYLYYDGGVNYFDDFELQQGVMVKSRSRNPRSYYLALSNDLDNYDSISSDYIGFRIRYNTSDEQWNIGKVVDTETTNILTNIDANKKYLLKLTQSGSNTTFTIFDYSTGSKLAQSSETINTSFRYLYSLQSEDLGLGDRDLEAYGFETENLLIESEKTNEVSLETPTDNTEKAKTLPYNETFEYKPIIHYGTPQYAELWMNTSGTWQNIETNNTVTNNTINKIEYQIDNKGKYIWNIGVYNGSELIFSDSNYTLTINEQHNKTITNNTITVTTEISKDYTELTQTITVLANVTIEPPEKLPIQTITTTTVIKIEDTDYEQYIETGVIVKVNNITKYSSFWGISNLLNMTLETEIGNWIFQNEVYQLTAYLNKTNYAELKINDTVHTIKYIYNNETETAYIQIKDYTGTYKNDNIAQSLGTNITELNENITKVEWKFKLGEEIIDSKDRVITWMTIDNAGNDRNGKILTDTYNIYNLGGLTEYSFNGNGSRVQGGDSLELQVKYAGDSAESYVYFRKLQHIHTLFQMWANNSYDNVTWLVQNNGIETRFEMEYYYENQWNDGWEVRINPTSAEIGTYGNDDDKSWVKLNIRWYYNETYVKGDDIIVFHHGYDKDRFPTSERYYLLWLDMWFNKMNSSTVVGGRVNGYYNGMEELGTWWLGYGDFRPLTGNQTSSMYFDNLEHKNEVIPSTEIEMIRFRAYITKTQDLNDNRTSSIRNYQVLNWKTTDGRFTGVDTPPFIEPKDYTVPKTTFLSPLIKAVESIGQFMWKGLIGAGRTLIGAIDSFMLYLGFQLTLSQMLNFVGTLTSNLITYIQYVLEHSNKITYIFIEMVKFIVGIISYVFDSIIWVIVWVLPLPIHIIKFMVAIIMGGTWTYSGYTWDFTLSGSLMDAMRTILPYIILWSYFMWLFFGDTKTDVSGLPKRIVTSFKFLRSVYQDIFWVFSRMYNSVISIYNFIRSHIPFLSSGGGETEE